MTDDWEDYVHTGPGTLAGRYLRRFWQPVCRVQDLAPGRTRPVHLMSERFTAYRGQQGTPHLVAFRCAHRGAQLSVGWVEDDSIRCRYHGWRYDGSGQCVEQPGEDPSLAAKIGIRSYPCEEYLGLVFAYLGEGEPPPLRRFPDFEGPAVLEAGPPEVWPCNYFNRIDNDPGHVPFTHRESALRAGTKSQLEVRSVQSRETEYGVQSSTSSAGRPPSYVHFHMPNINQTRSVTRVEGSMADARNLFVDRIFWRLPIDDEHCISYVVDCIHLTGKDADAYRARRQAAQGYGLSEINQWSENILAGEMRIEDVDPELSTYKLFWIEDYATQVGQGPIADRSDEHLGKMDEAVILKRKLWERELQALAEGRPLTEWTDPPGLADMTVVQPAAPAAPGRG